MIYEVRYFGQVPSIFTKPARAVQLKAGFEVWKMGYDVIVRDDRKTIATSVPLSDEHLGILESKYSIKLHEMEIVY